MQQNSSIDYIQAANGVQQGADEKTESKTAQKSDLGLLKLSSSYKPNADNHFDYDFLEESLSKARIELYFHH